MSYSTFVQGDTVCILDDDGNPTGETGKYVGFNDPYERSKPVHEIQVVTNGEVKHINLPEKRFKLCRRG